MGLRDNIKENFWSWTVSWVFVIRGYSLATAEVFLTVWERDSQALGTEVPTVGNTVPRRLGTFCDLLKKCQNMSFLASNRPL